MAAITESQRINLGQRQANQTAYVASLAAEIVMAGANTLRHANATARHAAADAELTRMAAEVAIYDA